MLLSSWKSCIKYPSRRKVCATGENALHGWIRLLLVMIVALVEQDVELRPLRQALEQLREEKAKEIGRANKLAEELNGEYPLVRVTAEVTLLFDGAL